MKNKLDLLSNGVKNVEYPIYMKHIESKDGYLTTYNNLNLVRVPYILPFEGLINFYVLYNILKKIDYPDFIVTNNTLVIRSGNFSTSIPIISLDEFVKTETILEKVKDIKTMFINNELMAVLNLATVFISAKRPRYQYIYIDKDHIISTDGSKSFYYESKLDVDEPFGIDKNVVNMIEIEDELGVVDRNSVIKRGDDLIISLSENMDTFPLNATKDIITDFNESKDKKLICSSEALKIAVLNIKPISFGEEIFYVAIKNTLKTLSVSCTSASNGFAEDSIEVDEEISVDILFNGNDLLNIPDGCNIYYIDSTRFYFVDKVLNCIIIIMAIIDQ